MNVLLDTGPLVALLNGRDQHHEWARNAAARLDAPLFTCEAVLAEAHHLLAGLHDGSKKLNEFLGAGRVDLSFRYADHMSRVHGLIEKYATVPMSFADACLVTLSEALADPRVFTVDDDFIIYRRKRDRPINVLMPESGRR